MPYAVKGVITGMKEAVAALDELGQTVRSRVLRKATTAGSKPVVKRVKELAPKETRLLHKSVGSVVRTYRNSGLVVVVIGPRSKPSFRREVRIKKDRVFRQTKKGRTVRVKNPKPEALRAIRNPAKYAHLLEKGTKTRKAHRFLRPAFDQTQAQARTIMLDVLKAETAKEIEKANAKARGRK